jgi:CCR4-NOT transcription complex subunit 1
MVIRNREINIRVMKEMKDKREYGVKWTNKKVKRCLIECREELRYNVDEVECIIS